MTRVRVNSPANRVHVMPVSLDLYTASSVATYMMWDLAGCRAIDTMVSLRCPHAVSANSSSHATVQEIYGSGWNTLTP